VLRVAQWLVSKGDVHRPAVQLSQASAYRNGRTSYRRSMAARTSGRISGYIHGSLTSALPVGSSGVGLNEWMQKRER
jgi:hypothetical protein